ncbi:MAG: hypothetical protein ICV60_11070 [Pyrinomonadaceae bacterium]|nr:hypothetical protein [Pyrinomonadaceae bacterium]
MKKLGWYQWLLLAVFLLAVIVTGLFAVRAVRRAVYWQTHRDEQIRPWMSVRYVARSYRVPPHVLYQAIKLEPVPRDRRPLREIAREQNRPVEALVYELQQAIKDFRANPPPKLPPPTSPPGQTASPLAGATP